METPEKNEQGQEQKPFPSLAIHVNIYNMTQSVERVNVFSKEHKPHTGVVVINDEKDLLNNPSIVISHIKLKFFKLSRMYHLGFIYGGRKVMYMTYFSKNQYQSTVMEIPMKFYAENILEFEVPAMGYINVTLFPSMVHKDPATFKGWPKEELEQKPGAFEYCAIIRNNTNHTVNVDLCKEYEGGKVPAATSSQYGSCTIEIPLDDRNEAGCDSKFKYLKIVGDSYNDNGMAGRSIQNLQPIVTDDNVISPDSYFSLNQYQSCVIDTGDFYREDESPFHLKSGVNKFAVDVLPGCEVMYHMFASKK